MKLAFMVKLEPETARFIEEEALMFGTKSAAIRFWFGILLALIKDGTIPKTRDGLKEILLRNRRNQVPVRDSGQSSLIQGDARLPREILVSRRQDAVAAAKEGMVPRDTFFLGQKITRFGFLTTEIVRS